MKEDILQVERLTKRFGGLTAVGELDLRVKEGHVFGLIGPNGAGKTTVLNLITGYLKPTEGEIYFAGNRLGGKKPSEVAQFGIRRTFQITATFPSLTVFENLCIGAHEKGRSGFIDGLLCTRRHRFDERVSRETANQVMTFLGLESRRNTPVRNLPYGEQRLVGIGVALAAGPRLLLLDEPAAGLNPEEVTRLMRVIGRIRDSGTTIVLVEHNMRMVMDICDLIAVLSDGRKVAEGTPHEVGRNPVVIEAYLGEGGERC